MKKYKSILCLMTALAVSLALFACSTDDEGEKDENGEAGESEFHFSEGIDENGFWEDIRALDYIENINYRAVPVPSDVHYVSDEAVQRELGAMSYRVTDRAVEYGDRVNIDYVGSIDGVEFAGGSTGGAGTNVTAGSTDYIDDFLMQIIGHMPGETVNVEVTFPGDYHSVELQGKDALFVTVINYISAALPAELTDEFVAEYLSAYTGWTTVDEMTEGIRSELRKDAVTDYVRQYLNSEVAVLSVPEGLIRYQERNMLNYYLSNAVQYGMEMDEFINLVGYTDKNELIEENLAGNTENAKYSLILQAVAEDAGLSVSDGDVEDYFLEFYGDYSRYEEEYGLPYLKQYVLQLRVIEYVVENAVLT